MVGAPTTSTSLKETDIGEFIVGSAKTLRPPATSHQVPGDPRDGADFVSHRHTRLANGNLSVRYV